MQSDTASADETKIIEQCKLFAKRDAEFPGTVEFPGILDLLHIGIEFKDYGNNSILTFLRKLLTI